MFDDTRTQKIDLNSLNTGVGPAEPFRNCHTERVQGLSAAGDTCAGIVRENNEDAFMFRLREDGLYSVFAVADGICGQKHGDIASKMCVKLLAEKWAEALQHTDEKHRVSDLKALLRTWIEDIGKSIREASMKAGYETMMGTTVVLMMVLENEILTLHAGDSRVYRLRDGELTQLTKDHTLVEELISMNMLLRSEASKHPFAHVISRSVGVSASVNPDISVFDRQKGDRYLLCSDGLTLHIEDKLLKETLAGGDTPNACVQSLIRSALVKGGRDNITAIAVYL